MAGLTGCAITGLVVVGWPIIGPGCTELPGIHPENLNFDIVYINQEIHPHCRHYWAGVDRAVRHSSYEYTYSFIISKDNHLDGV